MPRRLSKALGWFGTTPRSGPPSVRERLEALERASRASAADAERVNALIEAVEHLASQVSLVWGAGQELRTAVQVHDAALAAWKTSAEAHLRNLQEGHSDLAGREEDLRHRLAALQAAVEANETGGREHKEAVAAHLRGLQAGHDQLVAQTAGLLAEQLSLGAAHDAFDASLQEADAATTELAMALSRLLDAKGVR